MNADWLTGDVILTSPGLQKIVKKKKKNRMKSLVVVSKG